ncbi:glyoxylate reductase [Limimonas halophila]|uniref:Glyoxylate reductase n=1 Tax=Limimonas halophila TaxID=1082479 RepID=A0A1G7P9G4_9PROT|nr:D-glycerate dehydrogenase [Limimonas halophila]SDF82110.1 glyoxylate reductase [Limimonas halophila]
MPSRPRVFASRDLPAAVRQRLERDYDARINDSDVFLSEDDLVAACQDAEALIPIPADPVSANVIDRLPPTFRAVGCFSVGTDHVDLAAARRRGIAVTHTPGVLTESTAEMAILLMLGAARRAHEGEKVLRSGTWQGVRPTELLGMELSGKRLGILGMGRIGEATARRARAFGMTIHYHNRRRSDAETELGAIFHETPDTLMGASDVLSIHAPATAETKHMVNAGRLAKLPEGAVVVNTARGDLVDDEALIDALKNGHVFAAGLDVYDGEPNVHPGYFGLENAFLMPHLGSATVETRTAMGMLCLDNLDAVFAGTEPPHRAA